MEKNYPRIFNQNDYGAVDLGNSTVDTIQSGGCFDCACAAKATFYGFPTDPVQMNQLFIQKGIYISLNADGSNKDLLPDNAVSQVYPDIKYLTTINYEPIPTDLNHIKELLDDASTTLTIRINFGHGNLHFVEAVACDGTVLHIANSISGLVEDFAKRYGNPVTANLHVLVFKGPVTQVQTASSPLAVRFTQAIQKSTNFDTVSDYFGLSAEQRVTPEAGPVVVERIKYLQDQVQTLHTQLENVPKPQAAGNAPMQAPEPPPSPVSSANGVNTAPTFSDGTNPVSGTQGQTVTNSAKTRKSPLPQVGPVSVKEFLRAIWQILFM